MRITFYGAAGGVTGSKHLIETNGFRWLLDCGLHQGKREEADILNRHFELDAKSVQAVALSHAHADHCGMLPVLRKLGFTGHIYTTSATRDIAEYILLDSAHLQEQDAEYINRHLLKGEPPLQPLYTVEDAERVLPLFKIVPYHEYIPIHKEVSMKLYDAGHILGSSISYFKVTENGTNKTLAYTGDLGQAHVPIIKSPEVVTENVETLIIETTYGNKVHGSLEEALDKLVAIVTHAVTNKGKIIVPAFSLGRTQEIVYMLHKLTDEGKIPRIPVYVDSPLANNISQVFGQHEEDFNSDVATDFATQGEDPLAFRNLHYVNTIEDSKKLNDMEGSCMIISASGMMEGGRVLHHLANNIENPNTTIVITGFQAEHTLGRRILHGEKTVRILNNYYQVKAQIAVLNEFSAHADRNGLLSYVSQLQGLQKVFLVHGEPEEAEGFRQLLAEKQPQLEIIIPQMNESFEI